MPVDLNDLATRMRVRVEDHQVVTDTGHGGLGGGDDASGGLDHRLELTLGVLVHPVDARAGQDVVELVDEEALPGRLQDPGRVISTHRHRPYLRLAQRLLGAAVQLLGARLRCVGAAVQLEVQLSDPCRQVASFSLRAGEEFRRAAEHDARRALDAAKAMRRLDHVRLRSAAPIAPAVEVQGMGRAVLVLVVGRTLHDLSGAEIAVVGVRGREVGEDRRAVNALPHERVVRRLVGVVPGELLGQEVFAA